MAGTLAAAVGCIMAAPDAGATEVITAKQLEGRWTMVAADPTEPCRGTNCNLTYDFAPCGQDWCGVEVKDANTCGPLAFRLAFHSHEPHRVDFKGRYQQTESTRGYAVRARLSTRKQEQALSEQLMLQVVGYSDGTWAPLQRGYSLHMLLARAGDAACRAQPVS